MKEAKHMDKKGSTETEQQASDRKQQEIQTDAVMNPALVDDAVRFVTEKYEEYSRKRKLYRTFSLWCIVVSALIMVSLMLTLEGKIVFLLLWIAVIIGCVSLMLHTDHQYEIYAKILFLNAEGTDEDEDEDIAPELSEPPKSFDGENADTDSPKLSDGKKTDTEPPKEYQTSPVSEEV